MPERRSDAGATQEVQRSASRHNARHNPEGDSFLSKETTSHKSYS